MKKFIRIFVFFALICTIFTSCHKEFNTIQKSKDAKYKLTKADEYFAKKKYSNARVLYEQLFPAYKGQDKFEELYYKYAFCHYYEKMYPEAEQLFKGFLEFFPNSVHAEEVDYMRAYSFYKQSPKLELEQVNTLKAINMMQTFINQHIGSPRVKDANAVIDEGRAKLELKEAREAQLFYNLGQYRASGIAYNNIINSFPETRKGDEYKLMVVKSYYKFAKLSIAEKQLERFEKVVSEYQDFADRYPESALIKEAESFNNLSKNNIKILTNEQTTPPARL
jgi:outer membrane protein assembly factor BamD